MAQKYLDEVGLSYVWKHTTSYVNDCNHSYTQKSVEVNGGPLASLTTNWPWKEDGKNVVPANLSMQAFIEGLYLKVINGTLGNPSYSWNPSLKNSPSASISPSGTVEIGTQATVTFAVSNTDVNNNTHSVTVDSYDANQSNKKFGYMLDDGTTWIKADYSQSKSCTQSGSLTATASLSKGGSSASVSTGDKFYVKEGENKLSVSQSGVKCQCVSLDPHTIYAVTNTGTKLSTVSKLVTADSQAEKTLAATTNNSAKVTGARAYWYGFLNAAPAEADLTNQYFRNITTAPSTAANGVGKTLTALATGSSIQAQAGFLGLIIAVPATKTITSVKQDGAPTELIGSANIKTLSIEAANGQDAINYKVYYWTWAAGGSKTKWILTIS